MNSKMLFYILKRVLLALLTIWIVITVTFFVMHSIPGGPFASEKAISAEAQAALSSVEQLSQNTISQSGHDCRNTESIASRRCSALL